MLTIDSDFSYPEWDKPEFCDESESIEWGSGLKEEIGSVHANCNRGNQNRGPDRFKVGRGIGSNHQPRVVSNRFLFSVSLDSGRLLNSVFIDMV